MKRVSQYFLAKMGNHVGKVEPKTTVDGDTYGGGVLVGHEIGNDEGNNVWFSFRQLPRFIKWLQAVEKEYNKKGKRSGKKTSKT